MATPSVTLRTVKNEDTGIDISVPRFQEEEAPLGGISILYEISVVTRLDLFKTRLHKSGDVVYFTIYKAYREIEDLYNKLNKKYPKAGLPPVPKASTAGKYTDEEKVEALDQFMRAVAKNIQICHSSIFTQFIGINSHRQPSFTLPKTESPKSCDISNDALQDAASPDTQKETIHDVPEIFSKMKNASVESKPIAPLPVKNADLFEEVKLTKAPITNVNNSTKGSTSQGLFDEFEDDNLFSSKPPEKPILPKKETPKDPVMTVTEPEPPRRKSRKLPVEEADDSQIIIEDRNFGDVTLFKMQENNDRVTEKEKYHIFAESLFEKSKTNNVLFPEDDIISPDTDNSVAENLDDLLNLEPLPNPSDMSQKSESQVVVNEALTRVKEPHSKPASLPDPSGMSQKSENKEAIDETSTNANEPPPKPVPLPRRKSLGKTETDSLSKPEVMPRKVFLTKPDVPSKPVISNRPPIPTKPTKPSPAISAKPSVAPKPKPPPKKPKPSVPPKSTTELDLDAANANKTENANTVSGLTNDLKELDILKYIEQEEKSLDAQLGLFD